MLASFPGAPRERRYNSIACSRRWNAILSKIRRRFLCGLNGAIGNGLTVTVLGSSSASVSPVDKRYLNPFKPRGSNSRMFWR